MKAEAEGKDSNGTKFRRARRDRNYPPRNSSLPISAEIIKRGEGTRYQEGYTGKRGKGMR